MKNTKAIVVVVLGAVALSACDNLRKTLTTTKAVPDEFAVYTRAPLTMPPDFGVRPNPNGDEQTASTETSTENVARRVLLTNSSRTIKPIQADTPGTSALLAYAGAQNAMPDIRQKLDQETTAFVEEDKTFMDNVLFWRKQNKQGPVVDANAESRRIQENQALGKPVNEGDSPKIETKSKAPLEGVFSGWFN